MSLMDQIRQRVMQQRVSQPQQSTMSQQQPLTGQPPQKPMTTQMMPSGSYPDRPTQMGPSEPAQMMSEQDAMRKAMQARLEAGSNVTGQTAGGNPMMAAQQLKSAPLPQPSVDQTKVMSAQRIMPSSSGRNQGLAAARANAQAQRRF